LIGEFLIKLTFHVEERVKAGAPLEHYWCPLGRCTPS